MGLLVGVGRGLLLNAGCGVIDDGLIDGQGMLGPAAVIVLNVVGGKRFKRSLVFVAELRPGRQQAAHRRAIAHRFDHPGGFVRLRRRLKHIAIAGFQPCAVDVVHGAQVV